MRLFTYLGVVLCLVLAIVLVFWMSGLGAGTVAQPGGVAAETEPGKNSKGEYEKNPFGKPGKGPQPWAEVESVEYDFGMMKFPLVDRDGDGKPDGDSHTFVVKNVGEGVLKLARGPSTCQCTMSDLKDIVEVPPGGSTNITVTWEPEFATDEFSKAATVWTNDPHWFGPDSPSSDGKVQFTVKGQVVQAVEVEPAQFSLGTLVEQQPTTFETEVFSRVDSGLEVSFKSSTSQYITVELEKVTDAEKMEERKALVLWRVKGNIEPRLPVGRVKESVVLATNDETRPEISLQVEAQRQGPMSIAGRYWNNGYTMVDFGRFSAEKGIETTLSLYSAKLDPPLELKLVSVEPEGLVVTTERDTAYADPDRERYLIKIQVPAGHPPERRVSQEAGLVRLETNLADAPEVKFHIVYESR